MGVAPKHFFSPYFPTLGAWASLIYLFIDIFIYIICAGISMYVHVYVHVYVYVFSIYIHVTKRKELCDLMPPSGNRLIV